MNVEIMQGQWNQDKGYANRKSDGRRRKKRDEEEDESEKEQEKRKWKKKDDEEKGEEKKKMKMKEGKREKCVQVVVLCTDCIPLCSFVAVQPLVL